MGIKKGIRKIAKAVFQSRWYPNKKILIESIPDRSCQSEPVFQYMLKEGLNKQYKLIWLVTDKTQFKDVRIKNVKFVNFTPRTKWEKMARMYRLCTSRAMLYTNRYIGKIFDQQLFVYLIHGTALKSRLKHCRDDEVNECDRCISLSNFFIIPQDEEELKMVNGEYLISGYPRNDYLFDAVDYAKVLFPEHTYDKIILWMPTFRFMRDKKRVDSSFDFPLGIPCIYTTEQLDSLNEYLQSRNMLLVVKPHPAQDILLPEQSNIRVIYDKDIYEKGIQLYQFIGSTDALITDYSSIYYDYLLTKKPIGVTIDDFDVYERETGFVFENILDLLKGEHIKDFEELKAFFVSVEKGVDVHLEEREQLCAQVHAYRDANSAERVYTHIVDELNKRYGNHI